jgi:hypothetical protein
MGALAFDGIAADITVSDYQSAPIAIYPTAVKVPIAVVPFLVDKIVTEGTIIERDRAQRFTVHAATVGIPTTGRIVGYDAIFNCATGLGAEDRPSFVTAAPIGNRKTAQEWVPVVVDDRKTTMRIGFAAAAVNCAGLCSVLASHGDCLAPHVNVPVAVTGICPVSDHHCISIDCCVNRGLYGIVLCGNVQNPVHIQNDLNDPLIINRLLVHYPDRTVVLTMP